MILILVGLLAHTAHANDYGRLKSPADFFGSCFEMRKLEDSFTCSGTKCKKEVGSPGTLEVSVLPELGCSKDEDCFNQQSTMVCNSGRCSCPHYHAFNISTCKCERAGYCREKVDGAVCHSHNFMRCENEFCSCFGSQNFRDVLIDVASLFCVLPLRPSRSPAYAGMGTGLIVLCVIGGAAAIILSSVVAAILYKNCACEKGDYQCDNVDGVPEQAVHNASWDYPSLDYIPKDEEIVFTLAQAKDMVGASNASTIHVTDEVAMAPLDHVDISKGISFDHDNMGYIEDESNSDS